ncbi:hypothetical protein THAOC_21246, partial [Thalassiosira oceanica]
MNGEGGRTQRTARTAKGIYQRARREQPQPPPPLPTSQREMIDRIGRLQLCLLRMLAPTLAFVGSGVTPLARPLHTSGSIDNDGAATSVPHLSGDRIDAADRWLEIDSTLRDDHEFMRDCDAVVSWVGVDRDESTVIRMSQPVESRQSESDYASTFRSAKNQVPPRSAVEAIEATQRWSSNFVRRLNLCPWAGQSLDTPGAMRFWVLLVGGDDGEELIYDRLNRTIHMAG